MPKIDGISAIATILIVSFAIDRVTTAIQSLLSYNREWRARFPNPALLPKGEVRDRAAMNLKLVYVCFAALLTVPVVSEFGQIRILNALGFPADRYLDLLVTGLILVGGSDRVSALLKLREPEEADNEGKPITVTGTLRLEDAEQKVVSGNPPRTRRRASSTAGGRS